MTAHNFRTFSAIWQTLYSFDRNKMWLVGSHSDEVPCWFILQSDGVAHSLNMFWVQVCAAEYVNQLISTCCSVLCFFLSWSPLKLVKIEVAHIFDLIVLEYF